jgi:hypothetical protein
MASLERSGRKNPSPPASSYWTSSPRATLYGVKTEEEYFAYGPKISLLTRGFLDKVSAPMILVNGERDTQQPIADLYLMGRHGDPTDAKVNPVGGHMGRSANCRAGMFSARWCCRGSCAGWNERPYRLISGDIARQQFTPC